MYVDGVAQVPQPAGVDPLYHSLTTPPEIDKVIPFLLFVYHWILAVGSAVIFRVPLPIHET